MLKKVLYNKIKIVKIPASLRLNSEEFIKFLLDEHKAVFFKYGQKYRLCDYNGAMPDYLGKATRFNPIPKAGGEVYKELSENDCVVYRENALQNTSFSHVGFINDDIEKYIEQLSVIDNCIMVNAKQVLIPFLAKASSGSQCEKLRKLLGDIFGEDYKNLVVELSLKDVKDGTVIETTDAQLFIQQLQDTKKKILDEAFVYLGVASPMGKLAHQSELEVEQTSAIPDILEQILLEKIGRFIHDINKKFKLHMEVFSNLSNRTKEFEEIEKEGE